MTLSSTAINYPEISQQYLPIVEDALKKYLPTSGTPYDLFEAMQYGVLQGGKRFRPILMLLCSDLFKIPHQAILPAACALEMIHAYSLIHDDMPCLDNDELRRGQPTVHKKYGEAIALLSGDALQAKASEIISTPLTDISLKAQLELCQVFFSAIGVGSSSKLGLVNGQALDVLTEKSATIEQENKETLLRQIHQGKTASLLRFATQAGAILTEQSREMIELLDEFGYQLGIIFQLVDDILDATSDTQTLGKTVGKDAQQNKLTFVSLYGVEHCQNILEEEKQKAMNQLKQLTTLLGDKTIESSSLIGPLESVVLYLATRKH